ncbi:MAG TPA: AAA family ATPase [Cytophagales bacterium]|nr:AAA family ATPase [Cytophagales bacterium]
MPFLSKISADTTNVDKRRYPFSIPSIRNGLDISLSSDVTFFVGENGSGKSTIIEAIASHIGFNLSGGSKNHLFSDETASDLVDILRLSWNPVRITNGFFMRAESFFNFASYVDSLAEDEPGLLDAYGGKSLHKQSHGESFLSLFNNRFSKGIYILDEPEAALSPARQLAFLAIINRLVKEGNAQFLIATHSPILMSYPGAITLSINESGVSPIDYRDTEHFNLTMGFLSNPEGYLRHLFDE